MAYAIRSAGVKCPRVTRAFVNGINHENGNVYVTAGCSTEMADEDWIVSFENNKDMSVVILSCKILETAYRERKLPNICWKKIPVFP